MEQILDIHYQQYTIDSLPVADRSLVDAAKEATKTAYAPYSHFSVGAALRLADGTVVKGSNQENVAYPSGLCAERTAMFAASSQHAGVAFDAIAIVACNPEGKIVGASPCGACRQVMMEYETHFGHKIRVVTYFSDDKILIFDGVESLLPFAFAM